jgi:hypothetical protein
MRTDGPGGTRLKINRTPADNRQLQDTMGGHDISPFVVSQTDAAKLIDHTLGDGCPIKGRSRT